MGGEFSRSDSAFDRVTFPTFHCYQATNVGSMFVRKYAFVVFPCCNVLFSGRRLRKFYANSYRIFFSMLNVMLNFMRVRFEDVYFSGSGKKS